MSNRIRKTSYSLAENPSRYSEEREGVEGDVKGYPDGRDCDGRQGRKRTEERLHDAVDSDDFSNLRAEEKYARKVKGLTIASVSRKGEVCGDHCDVEYEIEHEIEVEQMYAMPKGEQDDPVRCGLDRRHALAFQRTNEGNEQGELCGRCDDPERIGVGEHVIGDHIVFPT